MSASRSTTPLDVLGLRSVDAIASLCRRALERPPAADELEGALFAPDQPAIVRGDPAVGVVVAVPGEGGGSIRLLVVDPSCQGAGHGSRLLAAAEQDLATADPALTTATVTVGADAPYFLFPGVETTQTSMLCLLEGRGYQRHEANYNMDVDLAAIPADPGGVEWPGPPEYDEIEAFMSSYWANWRAEVLRALGKRTLLINRDERGVAGFCAWDVNRRGLLGPVAVRPDLMGRGTGMGLLVGALHRMRAAGAERVEVCWVGPILPYARVGGTVGRVFFVYRKTLKNMDGQR